MGAVFGIVDPERIVAFARKYPVFPCGQDKRPLVKTGFHAATQDAAQIRAWWRQWPEALVGVPTGQGTQLVVVDYDPDKATQATHSWIADHTDLLCSTRTHKTGRGGLHYLFQSKDRYQTGVDLVLDGSPRKGIDLRANGGYVIWWPFHTGDNTQDPIAPVPADLIDERRFNERRDLGPLPTTSPDEWRRERDRVEAALTHLAPDGYEHWIRIGMALHHASGGSDEGFALWHEWSGRGESYDGIEDCRYHWASFGGYSGRALGLGTVYAAAKAAGFDAAPQRELPPLEAYADDLGGETPEEQEPAAAPCYRVKWRELTNRTPPERTWLIDHWLTYGITLMAGRGGIGKTLLAQTIATAIALGRNFVDRVTEPRTVLMWACEDDHDELWRRQIAINSFFGCTMDDIADRLIVEARVGAENAMLAQAFGSITAGPAIKQWHEQIADYRAEIAILDNVAHAFGGNENDRHHVTTFINALAPQTDRPLATVLLGHTARSVGSEFAGSAAWENAARMRWLLDTKLPDVKPEDGPVSEDGVRYLAKRKANYSVNDWRRFTYVEGTYRPDAAMSRETSYADQSRAEDARRCVLSGLKRLTAMNIPTTRAANSPAHLPRLMVEMGFAEDYSRSELNQAMSALLVAGVIEIGEVGKYDKGGKRTGLKLADSGFPK